jgi:hypothetical protein
MAESDEEIRERFEREFRSLRQSEGAKGRSWRSPMSPFSKYFRDARGQTHRFSDHTTPASRIEGSHYIEHQFDSRPRLTLEDIHQEIRKRAARGDAWAAEQVAKLGL